LGLSETILVFKQHTAFLGGVDALLPILDAIKARACEKKINVEVEDREDAIKLCRAGVDAIQFDKIPPEELKQIVRDLKRINPSVTIIATGGINIDNVEKYAGTGIDSINTSWIYYGKPVDIGVEIKMTEI
jgi:molybdenum transport protein